MYLAKLNNGFYLGKNKWGHDLNVIESEASKFKSEEECNRALRLYFAVCGTYGKCIIVKQN